MLDTSCYCMKCKQKTPTGKVSVVNAGVRSRMTGVCCVCGTKKSKFLSEKEDVIGGGALGMPRMSGFSPMGMINPMMSVMKPTMGMFGLDIATNLVPSIIGQVIANKAAGNGIKKRGRGVNYVKGWSGSKAVYDAKIKALLDNQNQ